jgi:hypothetical protein
MMPDTRKIFKDESDWIPVLDGPCAGQRIRRMTRIALPAGFAQLCRPLRDGELFPAYFPYRLTSHGYEWAGAQR